MPLAWVSCAGSRFLETNHEFVQSNECEDPRTPRRHAGGSAMSSASVRLLWKREGRCTQCGRRRDMTDRAYCRSCADKTKRWGRQRRERVSTFADFLELVGELEEEREESDGQLD